MKRFFFFLLFFFAICSVTFYFGTFFISQRLSVNNNLGNNQIENSKVEPDIIPVYLMGPEKTKKELIDSKKDFIETNLSEMKIRVYKNGEVEKELPIQVKGDPQGWGGSAAGLNSAIYKTKLAFSSAAEVYMPYSIKFYGKYFIHGEPYYPKGDKRITDVTGGCIQLSNEDAKTLYGLVKTGMPILVIDKENYDYNYSLKKPADFPEISAKSYLVADLGSGFVFQEKNSQEQLPIASLTKLMTATVISENVDLRKKIMATREALTAYGTTTGLEAGKKFGIIELFYPLLIESSNDAAEVLSRYFGRNPTIEMMNEKAKTIMMASTSFADPAGIKKENVSTARDLFYLARYILNNRPPIFEITKGNQVNSFGDVGFTDLKSKNVFSDEPDFLGGKTGYIVASRYTGLFLFRLFLKDGSSRRVAIILLGVESNGDWQETIRTDTQNILSWLKENYF